MEKWMNGKWMSEWKKKSMTENRNEWLNECMDEQIKELNESMIFLLAIKYKISILKKVS